MRVRVLGSAAGGGAPQWNCACPVCRDARRDGRDRTQDTVAVTGDGTAWYLLNAGPDIRTQILRTPELAPGPGLRETPLRGVLLTTAELDHTLGLLSLREAVRISVFATATVTHALTTAFPLRPMLGAYTDLDWRDMPTGVVLDGGLVAQRITVGTKRPRYAGDAPGDDWVSALRLTDTRGGSSFVYATCLPVWTPAFDVFVAGADEVLLDGTFTTDDELTRSTGRPGTAQRMGHLPMAVSRPMTARHPATRFRYGHLNNTNPSSGDDIAGDGLELFTDH
ncbi:pyrroloquinoline quinone biosynthesis protein PqqB [Actinoplanes cyaneus]|uniref:pyrroloquinoline quinone biosynthesis protein PqqB n=1 Tax=Actinoplanes cyaneus TaxID=52696 RepID=UPI0019456909|nr:MBL fold metallo-hydrolase [Actinoplanes cyaneus]MCW2141106.1 pyrroloquinoline quinone biosynthesis protein B [Actinoplanes cyaneus]